MEKAVRFLLCLTACLAVLAPARAGEFTLADGDRVVLVGNTLIEREQRYGYWETALTRRFPDKNVTFRNLGWSGDTVFGEARASFDPPAVGFRRLIEHTLALKPTVIFVAYGLNESFQGEAGLTRFTAGLNALLDALAPAKARIALLSPQYHEDLGRPLPDPAGHNRNLQMYYAIIQGVAERRGHGVLDLYSSLADAAKAGPLTDNGIHLTAYGYWRSSAAIEQGLGLKPLRWRIEIDKVGNPTAEGVKLANVQAGPVRFDATDVLLPSPLAPRNAPAGAALPGAERVLRVQGLADGKHTLHIDGKAIVTATAAEWAAGVPLTAGPELDQAERLRAAVIEKNHLYFYRWRPQNETYLFGFRKNEQGQNAKEVPEFDPLVEKQEQEIAKLRVPATHRYELTPERGK